MLKMDLGVGVMTGAEALGIKEKKLLMTETELGSWTAGLVADCVPESLCEDLSEGSRVSAVISHTVLACDLGSLFPWHSLLCCDFCVLSWFASRSSTCKDL